MNIVADLSIATIGDLPGPPSRSSPTTANTTTVTGGSVTIVVEEPSPNLRAEQFQIGGVRFTNKMQKEEEIFTICSVFSCRSSAVFVYRPAKQDLGFSSLILLMNNVQVISSSFKQSWDSVRAIIWIFDLSSGTNVPIKLIRRIKGT